MSAIRQIRVFVHTGVENGAGTDGDVFVGICGREFRIDTSGFDDFEAGHVRDYRLGEDANIANAGRNDPRSPQLDSDNLDKFPVYIRFEPSGSGSDWNLSTVRVSVEGRSYGAGFQKGLWLGQSSGKFCYLSRGNVQK